MSNIVKKNRIVQLWNHYNTKFQSILKSNGVLTRPQAGPGLWIAFLLPAAVLVSGWPQRYKSSICFSCCIYSINLLLNTSNLLIYSFKRKSIYLTSNVNSLLILLHLLQGSVTLHLYLNYLQLDFRRSICYTLANALIYYEGLPFILKALPKSFTFGEANIVIHGLSLFIYSTFLRLNKIFFYGIPNTEYNTATTILQIGLFGVLVLCIVPYSYKGIRKVLPMYVLGFSVVFGGIIPSLQVVLDENPLLWLLYFFTKTDRVGVLILWLVCSFGAGLGIWFQINVKKHASTVIRKYFHILAVIVFTSGILLDTTLLYLSSGGVLAVFIVLEIFRVLKIPPLYEFLQDGFQVYADEKDSGIVALTPIYLLIGCSLPLWLHPLQKYSSSHYLPLLSGVLSTGVGDTCASFIGKKFGKHHWSGSKKTIEGTFGCIFGQIGFIAFLTYSKLIPDGLLFHNRTLIAVITTSFVEAATDQVDNIVLPLTMYILFSLGVET